MRDGNVIVMNYQNWMLIHRAYLRSPIKARTRFVIVGLNNSLFNVYGKYMVYKYELFFQLYHEEQVPMQTSTNPNPLLTRKFISYSVRSDFFSHFIALKHTFIGLTRLRFIERNEGT